MFLIDVSFDGGKTWKTVDRPEGLAGRAFRRPLRHRQGRAGGHPPAQVRYRGIGEEHARADTMPASTPTTRSRPGGFRPVQVTYVWEEGGWRRRTSTSARSPAETYTIACESTPVMKSLIVELVR